jgi:hypothetical protein
MDLAVHFNSFLAKSSRWITGARSAIAKSLGSRVRQKPGVAVFLYLCGSSAAIAGCVIFIPSIVVAIRMGDPLLLLGAPIIMNGIFLFLFGVLIFSVGSIVELLSRISSGSNLLDAEPSAAKVVIRCQHCSQQLRIDRDRKGTLRCPRCNNKFMAEDGVP